MGKITTIVNFKGGVGKTFTAASLAFGLAALGKSVLCIDADAQHSLSVSFGLGGQNKLTATLPEMMMNIVNENDFDPAGGIFRHAGGVDVLPTDSSLAGLEISLAGLIGRETVLRQYTDMVKHLYDHVIIDCGPSLNLVTINAMAAADDVIIPVIPRFLDAKGLELLLKSIAKIKKQINPGLKISGILLTMVDRRAHFTRDVMTLVETAYGGNIRIFSKYIPHSVRATESTAAGISIFTHEPNGKIAAAYAALVEEVIADGA